MRCNWTRIIYTELPNPIAIPVGSSTNIFNSHIDVKKGYRVEREHPVTGGEGIRRAKINRSVIEVIYIVPVKKTGMEMPGEFAGGNRNMGFGNIDTLTTPIPQGMHYYYCRTICKNIYAQNIILCPSLPGSNERFPG